MITEWIDISESEGQVYAILAIEQNLSYPLETHVNYWRDRLVTEIYTHQHNHPLLS